MSKKRGQYLVTVEAKIFGTKEQVGAYEGKWPNVFTWPWLVANKRKMLLHQNTSELIDKIVLELQGRPSHETRRTRS